MADPNQREPQHDNAPVIHGSLEDYEMYLPMELMRGSPNVAALSISAQNSRNVRRNGDISVREDADEEDVGDEEEEENGDGDEEDDEEGDADDDEEGDDNNYEDHNEGGDKDDNDENKAEAKKGEDTYREVDDNGNAPEQREDKQEDAAGADPTDQNVSGNAGNPADQNGAEDETLYCGRGFSVLNEPVPCAYHNGRLCSFVAGPSSNGPRAGISRGSSLSRNRGTRWSVVRTVQVPYQLLNESPRRTLGTALQQRLPENSAPLSPVHFYSDEDLDEGAE